MKYRTGNEIRNLWLDFFKSKGHRVEEGASLIPKDDPTLLWINSGVAALKKYFDGSEIPPSRRICNVQKAIRTNDIDNVGYTSRHHTFFEMLGNFSIGDYFRKEVIEYAAEILTKEEYFGFDKDKLYITYHPTDLETKKCWIDNGIDQSHLIPLEHNFWEIGEGPCGPNTEVFYDRGESYDKEHRGIELLEKEIENDRYIELWGIVFSQYNAVTGVKREDYKELPSKNIDTGAGLERITCIIQDTPTNFETDLFYPIIEKTQTLSSVKYQDNLIAYRVIADHIRAITFALSDGESFSSDGRGYVLRRLLRRALRYGRKIGIYEPFLYKLVDTVYDIYKDFYPYLGKRLDYVKNIIKSEEEKFLKTLENGESLLNKIIEDNHYLSGEDMFKLYDTYGFPKELSIEICNENGIGYDESSFDTLMKKQKDMARASRGDLQSMSSQSKDLLEFNKESEFIYESIEDVESTAIGLFSLKGEKVDVITDEGMIIFDRTNFYAEMGGQIADIGDINGKECSAKVVDTRNAPHKEHLHIVKVLFGQIHLGDKFTLSIDKERREKIMRNHSATHLLQAALEEVLGDHVAQSGSYVSDEMLRFDFTHPKKMSEEEIALVEDKVNAWIAEGIEEKTLVLPIDEARKIGARALFNDKYGDIVRVVTFGEISKEFCGGTHVSNTKEIGYFVIESEESIAAGIRRIVAKTSIGAYYLSKNRKTTLLQVEEKLGASSYNEITSRLTSLVNERDSLKRSVAALNSKIAESYATSLLKESKGEYPQIIGYVDGGRDILLSISDYIRNRYPDYVICLVGNEGKGNYPIISFTRGKPLTQGVNSGDLVRTLATSLVGKGGGKSDSASGVATDLSNIDKALELVKGSLK